MDAGGTFALVVDYGNSTIRKVDIASGLVTTLAGKAMITGSADGIGTAARFAHPTGIALTADGRLALVADSGNDTVRAIDVTTGWVRTLAQISTLGGVRIAATGSRIQFAQQTSIDPDGCTGVIADSKTHTIRKVDLWAKDVSILSGRSGNPGSNDGSGSSARFNAPEGVTLTNGGSTTLVADTGNNTIRRVDGIPPSRCPVFLPLVRR